MSQLPPSPSNPYQPTAGGSVSPTDLAQAFHPLYERKGMISLIGILCILGGALYCLTIIGAVIGVPVIIMGLALTTASKNLDAGVAGGNPTSLFEASSQLAKFFFIAGILAIIGLIFNLLYFGFIIVAIFAGGLQ